jgi:hypothetical protein
VAGFLFLPVRQWFLEFEDYVRQLGSLGPLLVILAYVASTVIFHPGSALTIGSGTLFGLHDRLYRRIHRRQSRRALFVPAGAQFSARESRAWAAVHPSFAPSIRRSASRVSKWSC